jgi:heterodisulfide reductase subunit B
MDLSYSKIKALKAQGFDAVTTICGLCQTMYATKQPIILREKKDMESEIPVKNLLALVGLAMGLDEDELGEEFNRTPPLDI